MLLLHLIHLWYNTDTGGYNATYCIWRCYGYVVAWRCAKAPIMSLVNFFQSADLFKVSVRMGFHLTITATDSND